MKNKDQIQAEALSAIGDLRMAGVEISMGVGKTLIGLKHMASNYTDIAKYLVVAPKRSIFQSWEDDIKEFKYTHLKEHITYSTYLSLSKQDVDYDCIYLDECHSLKASHNQWLLEYMKEGGRIIGLTGTYPPKRTTEKGKMCNFYCPKVYKYHTDDAIADNILNDYEVFVHELTLSSKQNIKKEGKFGEFMSSELRDYNYWTNRLESANSGKEEQICRIQRMKCLQGFSSKEKYAKILFDDQVEKTIVFTNTKDQADNLCLHSYHSSNILSDDNLIDFKEGTIIKLSAVEQLNEGVTIPNLRVGIIMHSYSNNRKATQKIGRLLRLNPNDKATIHILCYENSVDKDWVRNALSDFDQSKIHWVKQKYYAGLHY
jgi:superfamily II DNA or RNA helicase